ncbi:transposase [Bryobacterales bacterium F-183]|nr:transposase [Bryobacterales bacterium F-183]
MRPAHPAIALENGGFGLALNCMARNPRVSIAGFPHHIVQRGSNGQAIFLTPEDRQVYLELASRQLSLCGLRLVAYCLMTNHVHLIAIPERGDSLSLWVQRVHGRYSQYFNLKTGSTGHVWHSRFFSCVLSPRHMTIALRYVEENPVRAGIVRHAADYPWSSCRAHLSGNLDPFLDRAEWELRGGTQGWQEVLYAPSRQPIIHMLRRCTFSGRPFGDEAFLQNLESDTGHTWKRWSYTRSLEDTDVRMNLEKLLPDFHVLHAGTP